MKRWNGWGDDSVQFPMPASGDRFLERVVGVAVPARDATFDEVVAQVPPSRLPDHRLVNTDPAARTRHARGQSFPDWLAMRSGRIGTFPDAVAMPTTAQDVQELLQYAMQTGAHVIPYGGGTSVVGHINPAKGEAPVLTVSLAYLNQLTTFDEHNHLATFGAGITGPELETRLASHGFTLGHYPQSFEYSTLGGWIVTRSSGQQSAGYGRIEQVFAGGRLHTPQGEMILPPFPASAAGPDLREVVLGSEGRLGIVTEATIRVRPKPERELFTAIFFPDWERATQASRQIAQARIPFCMMRISNPRETESMLALAGHERLTTALGWALSLRGASEQKCMMLLGFCGQQSAIDLARKQALNIARSLGGINTGRHVGHQWIKNRFRAPYLRNTLWERGYGIDTLETAVVWDRIPAMVESVERALREAIADTGERVHVFTHLSHVYSSGTSAYTTYIFRLAPDPEETLRRWQVMKGAASRAVVQMGGTISHQHGVGVDHAPYLQAEKGKLGIEVIRSALLTCDPNGLMNPGKLIP